MYTRKKSMKRSIIISMALFFLLALSSTQAQAQWVLGASLIQETGDSIQLYTATALDAYAYEFYDAAVAGSIYLDATNDENLVAENGASGGQLAETYVITSARSDRDFFGYGDHHILYFYYDEVLALWYDRWGFSLFSGDYLAETTCYGCNCPYFVPPRLEYLFSTLVGIQSSCKEAPTIEGDSLVVRVKEGKYKVRTACRFSEISDWKFTENNTGVVVARTIDKNADNWGGKMVTSGVVTVTVKYTRENKTFPLSQGTTVSARTTGFYFNAASPTVDPNVSESNRILNCGTQSAVFPVDPPRPAPNDPKKEVTLANYCLDQTRDIPFLPIDDQGPNRNFKYITAATNQANYRYALNPSLNNPLAAFFKAQCGNYDEDTKPDGFILGSVLRQNSIDHEANLLKNSHWFFYKTAQDDPNNNIGVVAERQTGAPDLADNDFVARVRNTLNDRGIMIRNLADIEPCGGAVNFNNNCVFNGGTNFFPYIECPR
jgi:hypothetical protein